MVYARMTVLDGQPDQIDATAAGIESDILPILREQAGFRGFTFMADRSSGRLIGTSYWDSEEDMKASEESVRPSRERAAAASGASGEPVVERYEVLVDVEA